ncbi:MAG: metallophosphoesterase family protein [Planctomycetaceae bacterium]
MKILLIADIHSNWPALSAITEPFDVCLCTGDIVDYGTDPVPCIDWVRQHTAAVVRGNHDHAVAQRVPVRPGAGYRQLASFTRPKHWELLSPARLKYLGRLPVTRTLTLEGQRFLLVHGTPRDPMEEYLYDNPQAWSVRLEGQEVDYVCVGHTHIPLHITLEDGRQIINPGSVGQPRDGDPRCSYAVIDNGRVEIRRVSYDIDAVLKQMREVGLDETAIEIAELSLRNGSLPSGI